MDHRPKRDHFECREVETDFTVYADTLNDVVEILAAFAWAGPIPPPTVGDPSEITR